MASLRFQAAVKGRLSQHMKAEERAGAKAVTGALKIATHGLRDDLRAGLKAAQHYFMQIVPLVTSRYVLVGWENRVEKFRTGGDGLVHPEVLATIPDDHRELIGWEGWALAYLSPEQRGN